MYWTTFKRNDSSLKVIDESVAVDDLIYSFSGDYSSLEPINIHILNSHTLIWSLLPARTDKNGETLKHPDVPIQRRSYTVVAYDKKIYLWGGENKAEPCNILYCFDTRTLNWSRPKVTGIIPGIHIAHFACISNHSMYIFGGYGLNYDQYGLRNVYCLDLKTMNWSCIETLGEKIPSSRSLYATTVVNNHMYIWMYGEYKYRDEYKNEKTTYFTLYYLDSKSNRWHHPETTGKKPFFAHHSIFVNNNIIYVFGICCWPKYGKLTDLYYLDTKRNHWNLMKPRGKSPILRARQSCFVIGDKMFLLYKTSLASEDEDEDEDEEEDKDEDSIDEYKNCVYCLDFNPSLKTLATMSVIENELDFSCLPKQLRSEIDSVGQHSAQ